MMEIPYKFITGKLSIGKLGTSPVLIPSLRIESIGMLNETETNVHQANRYLSIFHTGTKEKHLFPLVEL